MTKRNLSICFISALFVFMLSACGGGNGTTGASGSNWDQMKWDQGKWQ